MAKWKVEGGDSHRECYRRERGVIKVEKNGIRERKVYTVGNDAMTSNMSACYLRIWIKVN
jgi:hypothetical protein